MMSIYMFICKMHVKQFRHMESSKHAVEPSRFMEYLVSHCELNCVQIREHKDEANEIE